MISQNVATASTGKRESTSLINKLNLEENDSLPYNLEAYSLLYMLFLAVNDEQAQIILCGNSSAFPHLDTPSPPAIFSPQKKSCKLIMNFLQNRKERLFNN